MKRVLVTGISGLVGSNIVQPLIDKGYAVYGVSRSPVQSRGQHTHLEADILNSNAVYNLLKELRPEYLIHLAWETKPDRYLGDNSNFSWLSSSIGLVQKFYEFGGKRAVCAGTCFEYLFQNTPLKEDGLLSPESIYAKCKCFLHDAASLFAKKNEMPFVWARIFYVFGKNEHPKRLFPDIIRSLKEDKAVEIRTPNLKKDYMYAPDIAAAFAHILDSGITGDVNVCSGQARSIGEIALTIGKILGKEKLIRLLPQETNQAPVILGDKERLSNEAGFSQYTDFNEALKEVIYG